MELALLEERVNYCNTKIVEILSDKSIPAAKAKFFIRYWEYQTVIAEREIRSIYEAFKKINISEWDWAISEVHGGGDEAMDN